MAPELVCSGNYFLQPTWPETNIYCIDQVTPKFWGASGNLLCCACRLCNDVSHAAAAAAAAAANGDAHNEPSRFHVYHTICTLRPTNISFDFNCSLTSGLVSVHHTFVCAIEIFSSYKNNYNKFFSIWHADKLNVSSYNFSIADIDRQTLEFYWSLRHSR